LLIPEHLPPPESERIRPEVMINFALRSPDMGAQLAREGLVHWLCRTPCRHGGKASGGALEQKNLIASQYDLARG
jgi:hypothetical protein